jgi:hypothetical protein
MNEKQLKRLTAYACFAFALCCILWVVFTYFLLPFKEGQEDYTLMINDPAWIYVTLLGLLSSVFGLFAVFGIYFANRDAGGVLLFVGVVILVLGLALEMASLTWDAFIWPVFCAHKEFSSFVSEGIFIKSIQFKIYIIALISFLFIGSILTAVGLLKTKRFGWLIPVLIIVGIILYGTGNFLVIHLATIGLCAYSISFVLIGLRLMKEQW